MALRQIPYEQIDSSLIGKRVVVKHLLEGDRTGTVISTRNQDAISFRFVTLEDHTEHGVEQKRKKYGIFGPLVEKGWNRIFIDE